MLDWWPDFPERDIWWVSGGEGCRGVPVRLRHHYHFCNPSLGLLAQTSEGSHTRWLLVRDKTSRELHFFSYWTFHIYLIHIFHQSHLLVCVCSGNYVTGCCGKRQMQKNPLARENLLWSLPNWITFLTLRDRVIPFCLQILLAFPWTCGTFLFQCPS